MRILSDSGIFTALSRLQEAPQRGAAANTPAPNGAREPLATSILPKTQSVSAASNTPAENKSKREPLREDVRAFAREAPNGQRPKFIPKGQSLDVSV
jgi:hypothetical protein